jgi:transposase-like protein
MSKSRAAGSSSSWRTRRRWTADDARAAIAAQERSGLSLAHFAAREGLEVHRLYRWSRRLGVSDNGPAAFVEVSPAFATAAPRESRFEVVLRSGQVVRVPAAFDGAALRRLVAALEEAVAC